MPSSTRWRLFARVHYRWAEEYISRWTDDPRGTGGTPYTNGCNRCWLKPRLIAFELQRQASGNGSARAKEFEMKTIAIDGYAKWI